MMDWGWFAGAVRIIEWVTDALTDRDLANLEPSVEWSFNSRRGDFDFTVEMTNRLNHRICIEYVKILKPSNGTLRHNSNPPIIDLDEPEHYRDRWLGNATSIMKVDQDVEPSQKSWVQFSFVPPDGWRGGVFECDMHVAVKRSKVVQKRIAIHRDLVR